MARVIRSSTPESSASSRCRAWKSADADHVHERETGCHRPAGVQPQQLRCGDRLRLARDERESAPAKLRPSRDQRGQRQPWAGCEAHADGAQHRSNHVEAADRCGRRSGAARRPVAGARSRRRRRIRSRVEETSRPLQPDVRHVPSASPSASVQPALPRTRARAREQRGSSRPPDRTPAPNRPSVPQQPLARQPPRDRPLRDSVRTAPPVRRAPLATSARAMQSMEPPALVGADQRHERFADPIVVQLDALRGAAAAQEMFGAKLGNERPIVAFETARLVHDLRRHRPAAERQHLQEPLCRVGHLAHAFGKHVGERRGPLVRRLVPGDMARQLPEKKRIAARLTHDVLNVPFAQRSARRDDRERERLRLIVAHRTERERDAGIRAACRASRRCRNGCAAISSSRKQTTIAPEVHVAA